MKLIIEDDEGHKTTVAFVRDEITVGREDGNTIRLTERNVSRRHARFLKNAGAIFVEDLRSYNGIKVNGDRIEGKVEIRDGDLVQIGDFDLALQGEQPSATLSGVSGRSSQPTEQIAAVDMHAVNGAAGALPSQRSPAATHASPASRPAVTQANPAIAQGKDPKVESDPSLPAAGAARQHATAVIRVPVSEAGEAVDIAPDQAPRLVIVSTELAGREFACIRSVLTIGRGDECDIVVNHRSLSRQHCRLEREPTGTWKVVDLGSANRLQVNDEEYGETTLHTGDVIGLGHVKLRFVAPGEDFTFDPRGPKKSMIPVAAALAVGALAIGGGGMYLFTHKGGPHAKPTAVAKATPKQAQPASPDLHATHPAAPPKPAAPTAAAHPNTPAAPTASPAQAAAHKREVALDAAQTKLADRDAKGALALLDAVDGAGDPAYQALHAQLVEESQNQALIERARRGALSADTAQALVDMSDKSVFHREAEKLLKRNERSSHAAVHAAREKARKRKAAQAEAQKASAQQAAAEAAPPAPQLDNGAEAKSLREEGVSLAQQGHLKQATATLKKSLALKPNDPATLRAIAGVLARDGNFPGAAVYYRQFIKLVPNDPAVPSIKAALLDYENTSSKQQ